MARISMNELTTYRWSFEEDVLAYAAQGFDSIGICRHKLAEFGVEKAIEFLRDHEMGVASLGWAGGFTGSDGRSYSESIHDALEMVELAAEIGAGCLVVVAGDRNGHTKNHVGRLLTRALTEISEAAAAMHIDVAIEPMHIGSGSQGCFLGNIQNTLGVIADVDWPGLGIVFDTYHLAHDPRLMQWLPEIAPLVRLVQLADARCVPMGEQDRCLLGQGRLRLAEIITCFEDAGYEGHFELELFGQSVEHLEYADLLEHSHRFMGDAIRTPARAF